jgi:predicted Na+-dependent transporter
LLMVVIPVGVGMIWRSTNTTFVLRHMKKIQNFAQIFLYVVVALIIYQDWGNFVEGIGPALPWSMGLCFMALSTGYGLSRLVGLSPVDSATVAIESSIRNLAVAFLISASVLGRLDIAILPTIYFIAVLLVGLTFARFWRTKMAPKYAEDIRGTR